MGMIARGIRNAFRNVIRTLSVTVVLAISIGLALIMLLSYQTVIAKIDSVKSSIGNTITVTPAGARGFEGGGEPLTDDQMGAIKTLPHITTVSATLNDRLTTGTDTTLASGIDPGTLGNRQGQFFQRAGGNNSGRTTTNQQPRSFTLPLVVTGLSDPGSLESTSGAKLTSGSLFDGASTDNVAIVGTAIASKNNLAVGSTFSAYNSTITVRGIYDAGNQFANNGVYMPIKSLQQLSSQASQVSQITVSVDSIDNIDATVSAIKAKIGADKADITSSKDTANQALSPLENIKTTSFDSLIGALAAGAVITLLIMMMIVRERRREIGVLKAIGASNAGIVTQFVSESLVLTILGGMIGMVAGALLSNPVLNTLINNNLPSGGGSGGAAAGGGGRGFARVVAIGGQIGGGVQNSIRNLHTVVSWEIILYGVAAAIMIAIIGSAMPAWLIAKIKPAEVMRGE